MGLPKLRLIMIAVSLWGNTETLFIVTESSYFSEYLLNLTVLHNFKSLSQVYPASQYK